MFQTTLKHLKGTSLLGIPLDPNVLTHKQAKQLKIKQIQEEVTKKFDLVNITHKNKKLR